MCAWLWTHTAQSSDWLYRGGLAAYALLSCAVILATIIPFGPVSRLMTMSGLRRVGELSYGIYVFHWPIVLWLDAERTGLAPWPLFGLRLLVTAAVAVPMYLLVESPVRAGGLRGWAPAGALAGMAVVVVGA